MKKVLTSEKGLIYEQNLLEKMAALYRFVEFGRISSGIFHDILTPLTTMSLTVEKLKKDLRLKNSEHVLHIESALHASRRIQGFLLTARKQLDATGTQKSFFLKKEIFDSIDLLTHKTNLHRVKIETCIEDEIVLYGNYVKFFQISLNLISNALDSFSHKKIKGDKKVHVTLTQKNSFIEFSVTDNGAGIDPEIQDKIFEPFFTTKTKNNGMGLGLSTTKSIVEKDFNGKIELESTLGKGSSFKVKIPF
ncbi:MAG: hypothetical protein RLZZ67_640 [Candidatus Parcubacteria bacterium]|jgi:signal transduction histidine kinase